MKIKLWDNETRVKFIKKDPEHACVSVTFPQFPNMFLFIDKNGNMHWYDEKHDVTFPIWNAS